MAWLDHFMTTEMKALILKYLIFMQNNVVKYDMIYLFNVIVIWVNPLKIYLCSKFSWAWTYDGDINK